MESSKLDAIRRSLEQCIGRKVMFTAKRGRKKITVRYGVIESTYPSVFVIKVDKVQDETESRRISFSYTDVFTKSVELVLYKQKVCAPV